MNIMPYRYQLLQKTVETYRDIHVPLVVKTGNVYSAAGFGDDNGIYLIIPWLVRFLGVSLDKAIDIFFFSLIGTGLFLSVIGFGVLFKKYLFQGKNLTVNLLALLFAFPIPWIVLYGGLSINRCNAIYFIFMTMVGLMIAAKVFRFVPRVLLFNVIVWSGLLYMASCARYWGDLYITEMFCVSSIIPAVLAWQKLKGKMNLFFIILMAFSGFIVGFCNSIHSEGGVGAFLFLVILVFLNQGLKWREKITAFLVLMIFALMPYGILLKEEKNRDGFLASHLADYKPATSSHPFWHSVYIGLGYIPNKYKIQYLDQSGMAAALAVDPKVTLYSEEYNQILKDKIISILKNDFGFIVKVVMAKMAMVLLYIVVFANVGIFLCGKQRPGLSVLFPFLLSGFFYSIPGLLVMPNQRYILGLISLSIVFCVYMSGVWMEKVSNNPAGAV